MHPEFYFYKVVLLDHQRAFDDEPDFITFVHILKWKTMLEMRDYERGL